MVQFLLLIEALSFPEAAVRSFQGGGGGSAIIKVSIDDNDRRAGCPRRGVASDSVVAGSAHRRCGKTCLIYNKVMHVR